MDHFTGFVVSAFLPNMEADTVAYNFMRVWITKYDFPKMLICDQGGQFTGAIADSLQTLFKIKVISAPAFHRPTI